MATEAQNEITVDVLNDIFNFKPKETTTEMEELSPEDILPLETETEEEAQTPTEEVITDPVETTEDIFETKETDSFKLAKLLMSTGELEDFIVAIDGEEKKLSEFVDIDEDTLKEVIKESRQEQKQALEKDYVKVKNLTETQQKLVDIVTKGNYEELKEVFKQPESLKEPWLGYDPSNDSHNEQVYRTYLEGVQKVSSEEADALIDIAKKNLTLSTKAEDLVQKQRDIFKRDLEEKDKQLEIQRKQEIEESKKFSKELSEKFKRMELKPEIALAMVKTATVKNQDQKTPIEDLFYDALKDVEKASELILFLTNKDIYDSKVKSKTKLDEQVQYVKKVNVIRDNRKNTEEVKTSSQTEREDALSDIFKIKQ